VNPGSPIDLPLIGRGHRKGPAIKRRLRDYAEIDIGPGCALGHDPCRFGKLHRLANRPCEWMVCALEVLDEHGEQYARDGVGGSADFQRPAGTRVHKNHKGVIDRRALMTSQRTVAPATSLRRLVPAIIFHRLSPKIDICPSVTTPDPGDEIGVFAHIHVGDHDDFLVLAHFLSLCR